MNAERSGSRIGKKGNYFARTTLRGLIEKSFFDGCKIFSTSKFCNLFSTETRKLKSLIVVDFVLARFFNFPWICFSNRNGIFDTFLPEVLFRSPKENALRSRENCFEVFSFSGKSFLTSRQQVKQKQNHLSHFTVDGGKILKFWKLSSCFCQHKWKKKCHKFAAFFNVKDLHELFFCSEFDKPLHSA